MTKAKAIEEQYSKELAEVQESCNKSRVELEEMGFKDTFVSPEVFQKVFANYWQYNIHEIRLMNVEVGKMGLQFMVTFEDDQVLYVYLKV